MTGVWGKEPSYVTTAQAERLGGSDQAQVSRLHVVPMLTMCTASPMWPAIHLAYKQMACLNKKQTV